MRMPASPREPRRGRSRAVFVLRICLLLTSSDRAASAGVTIITHGLNGDTDGWVTGMANQIPNYERFVGTNYSTYHVYFFYSGGSYYLTATRNAGSEPLSPESGEIILKLDWRQLADGNSYNTYQVASAVVPALLTRISSANLEDTPWANCRFT